MNTQTHMSQSAKLIYSDVAQKAIEAGCRNHHRFRVVGSGGVPEKPFYQGGWWFEPVREPPAGKEILDVLKRSGVVYKGIVVAHEVTLVEVPEKQETKTEDFKIHPNNPSIPNELAVADILGSALAVFGSVLLVVVPVFLELFVQMILIDPAVIVVLEDNTWLEICFYYE
jgi:hypothetical protein